MQPTEPLHKIQCPDLHPTALSAQVKDIFSEAQSSSLGFESDEEARDFANFFTIVERARKSLLITASEILQHTGDLPSVLGVARVDFDHPSPMCVDIDGTSVMVGVSDSRDQPPGHMAHPDPATMDASARASLLHLLAMRLPLGSDRAAVVCYEDFDFPPELMSARGVMVARNLQRQGKLPVDGASRALVMEFFSPQLRWHVMSRTGVTEDGIDSNESILVTPITDDERERLLGTSQNHLVAR